jgi:transposase-like protein
MGPAVPARIREAVERNRDVNAAKTLSSQCDEEPAQTDEDHAGRLCGITSRSPGNEGSRRTFPRVWVRSSQYLNNLIEQDHRRVKQRIRPMLGFKRFDHAAITISGIELAEKIKKGQFKIGKLRNRTATMSEQWSAALAV